MLFSRTIPGSVVPEPAKFVVMIVELVKVVELTKISVVIIPEDVSLRLVALSEKKSSVVEEIVESFDKIFESVKVAELIKIFVVIIPEEVSLRLVVLSEEKLLDRMLGDEIKVVSLKSVWQMPANKNGLIFKFYRLLVIWLKYKIKTIQQ